LTIYRVIFVKWSVQPQVAAY